jgi:hypothetical protein
MLARFCQSQGCNAPDGAKASRHAQPHKEARNTIVEQLANISIADPVVLHAVPLKHVEDGRCLPMTVWSGGCRELEDGWAGQGDRDAVRDDLVVDGVAGVLVVREGLVQAADGVRQAAPRSAR